MIPLSILYVDDDADIRTIVAMSLALDSAIDLHVAASGEEAMDMIANGLTPDMALLDVMMPGLNGLRLLDMLRARPATAMLPTVFMTARAQEADIGRYLTRGAIGVILKPFDPLRLAAEIRALLAADTIAKDREK